MNIKLNDNQIKMLKEILNALAESNDDVKKFSKDMKLSILVDTCIKIAHDKIVKEQ